MRLVNFRRENRIEFGVLRDGFVRSLASVGYSSDAKFFAGGAKALEAARALAAQANAEQVRLEDCGSWPRSCGPEKFCALD